MDKKIINKIVEKQKELLTDDKIFNRILADITKEQLLEDIEKPAEEARSGVLKIAPIGVKKDIQNHRDDYDSSDLEILNCELYDNARDACADIFEIISKEDAETIDLDFYDNGKGVRDLREYLKLGGESKDRKTKTIGLAGQGAKLMMPFIIIFGVTETKLEDGTIKAQLWFFCHAKNSIVYLELKPENKIKDNHGTYIEIKILKEALDYCPPNIEDSLHSIYMNWYRTHLLTNEGQIRINGNDVVPEKYPEPENGLTWKPPHTGFLIVTSDPLDKSEQGLTLNIEGKDVMILSERDFGIDLPFGLVEKITGYIKADELKVIIKVNKEGINKKKVGCYSTWQKFKNDIKNQIVEFLKEKGYLENKILKGNDSLTTLLNRDLQYLFKHNSDARKILKDLLSKKRKGLTPGKSTGAGSKQAQTENRIGPGKLTGKVIFEKESRDKGFDINTDVEDFFKVGEEAPYLLGTNEKYKIKIYKKVIGQKELIHLTPDIECTGPDFVIDNVPLDTLLLVKAYTTYGVPKHTNELLGRPKSLIKLTQSKKEEKVVISIQVQENFSYKLDDRVEELDYGFIERKVDDDGVLKDIIIVNTAHPLYKMHENDDRSKYNQTLSSIIYAICSTADQDDDKKRLFKKFLNVILNRR